MARIVAERRAAEIEGDFVVFLIGMRINKPWKLHRWWPVFTAMPRMLRELAQAGPETGFLGHTILGLGGMVQYWRSFEHLEAYASAPEMQHWPARRAFNKAARGGHGDVGIWHETYLVKAGNYEAIYAGMPPFGLGKAAGTVPATGSRAAARQRLAGAR